VRLRTANLAVGYRYISIYTYTIYIYTAAGHRLYITYRLQRLYHCIKYIHILQAKTTNLETKIFNHLAAAIKIIV